MKEGLTSAIDVDSNADGEENMQQEIIGEGQTLLWLSPTQSVPSLGGNSRAEPSRVLISLIFRR